MRIPDPYFENILNYGDLRMEQILVEYDYPLLSVLVDRAKNRYLSMCFDTRGSQQWLIAPISSEMLIKLLTNRIALDVPYRESQACVIYAVRNYETKAETFCEMRPLDIPDEDLPAKGEYLDAEEDEWETYIEQLREEDGQWIVSYKEPPIWTVRITKPLVMSLVGVHVRPRQGFEGSTVYSVHQRTSTQTFSPGMVYGAY